MVTIIQNLPTKKRKRGVVAADFKNRTKHENTHHQHEGAKRRRTNSKIFTLTRNKTPRLPRPRNLLKFELAEHLVVNEAVTSAPKGSLKATEAQFRGSTPGVGLEPPLTRLSRVDVLFNAIHRRNKNQHRNQPFYKQFSFLRRSVKKLISLHGQSAALNSTTSTTSLPKTTVLPSAAETRQRFEKESRLRSQREILEEHIRETLVPAAYVAFSGVVADTQFANLGMVLLGILADVVGVVGSMRRIEEMKEQSKNRRNTERAGNGGRLVALSTLMTGPDHGAVVERVYDSDGGLDLENLRGKTSELNKVRDDGNGSDTGEAIQRDETEMSKQTPDELKPNEVKLDEREDKIQEQDSDTDAIRIQEKDNFNTTNNTLVSDTQTLRKSTPPIHNTVSPPDQNKRVETHNPVVAAKSKITDTNSGSSKATPLTTKKPALPISKSKASETAPPKARSKTEETKQKETSKQKPKIKTKTKKKATNAIDDLFSGFG